jgi:hypothetical protein
MAVERASEQPDAFQPDDTSVIVRHARAAMFVPESVRLCVPVHQRVRVIDIRLVQMLLRDCRGEQQPGREREDGRCAAQPEEHA